MENKLWYAAQQDSGDPWDTGSLDRKEAERKALLRGWNRIATISIPTNEDGTLDNSKAECIAEDVLTGKFYFILDCRGELRTVADYTAEEIESAFWSENPAYNERTVFNTLEEAEAELLRNPGMSYTEKTQGCGNSFISFRFSCIQERTIDEDGEIIDMKDCGEFPCTAQCFYVSGRYRIDSREAESKCRLYAFDCNECPETEKDVLPEYAEYFENKGDALRWYDKETHTIVFTAEAFSVEDGKTELIIEKENN